MSFPYEEFDVEGVRTYPLATRKSKSNATDFARPYEHGSGMSAWVDSLPDILAAADFKAVLDAILRARRDDRGLLWGIGAHVIKTGLSPVIIDLMDARIRVGDCDQRRRRHPRLRARAVGRDLRGRR